MAAKKDLDWYLVQARRIAEHREAGAEEAIRKEFKKLLKSLKAYIGEVHEKYAAGDGTLSFADLQKAGYDARFLEEIEKRISVATPKVAKELHQLVNDTYKLAYESMVQGVEKVAKGADLDETFSDAVAITPDQIKAVVNNPYMENALLKNHQTIIYDIRQAVSVGLMNGDRYNTIAQKITVALDKENGPYKNAMRIARTEAHRVREAGNKDAAEKVDKELQNGTTGLRMCKTWKTMKDERVRPQYVRKRKKGGWVKGFSNKGANHMKLEGQTVLATEPFDLQDGNKADAPGSSGVAGHDIHCRCYASYEMLTDAEFYAKTGRHFPGYKGKETQEANEAELTRAEMRQRIKDDKARITGMKAEMRDVDLEIAEHHRTVFDDLKGLKKSDISGRIQAIEEREKVINPIVDRLYNRPARGTPEYEEWREWKKGIDRDAIIEEQMRLASEKAALNSKLRRYERYEQWQQWKVDHPLDKLEAKKKSIEDAIKRLEDEIKDFEKRLAANPVLQIVDKLEDRGVSFKEVKKHVKKLSDSEIVSELAGGDMTSGSCASVGIAYIGQKHGLNVLDFRGGESMDYFSGKTAKLEMFKALGATPIEESSAKSNLTNGKRILSNMAKGKEYYLSVGRHAAIVRLNEDGVPQYLELQSSSRNGWHDFNNDVRETLKWRFGCSSSSSYWNAAYLTDIDQFPDNDDFRTLLGYINTNESEQRKGKHGTIK